MQMRSILFYLKLDGTNFYGSKRERKIRTLGLIFPTLGQNKYSVVSFCL